LYVKHDTEIEHSLPLTEMRLRATAHLVLKISSYEIDFEQEPQLPQRDRATLRVTEYFVESLKVIRNDTAE